MLMTIEQIEVLIEQNCSFALILNSQFSIDSLILTTLKSVFPDPVKFHSLQGQILNK